MLVACFVLMRDLDQNWRNPSWLSALFLVAITLAGLGCYFTFGRAWLFALIVTYLAGAATFLLIGLLPVGLTPKGWGLGLGGCVLTLGEIAWALVRDRELDNLRKHQQRAERDLHFE